MLNCVTLVDYTIWGSSPGLPRGLAKHSLCKHWHWINSSFLQRNLDFPSNRPGCPALSKNYQPGPTASFIARSKSEVKWSNALAQWVNKQNTVDCNEPSPFSHVIHIYTLRSSIPSYSVYSPIISKRDRKRWKKFLQGSGMARVPNSDITMRSLSLFFL